jgi:hypothetical protein
MYFPLEHHHPEWVIPSITNQENSGYVANNRIEVPLFYSEAICLQALGAGRQESEIRDDVYLRQILEHQGKDA